MRTTNHYRTLSNPCNQRYLRYCRQWACEVKQYNRSRQLPRTAASIGRRAAAAGHKTIYQPQRSFREHTIICTIQDVAIIITKTCRMQWHAHIACPPPCPECPPHRGDSHHTFSLPACRADPARFSCGSRANARTIAVAVWQR
jgi:hypothetical protein